MSWDPLEYGTIVTPLEYETNKAPLYYDTNRYSLAYGIIIINWNMRQFGTIWSIGPTGTL